MSKPLDTKSTMNNEAELRDIYDALAHEVRREILRILGAYSHRGISFSEINSELRLKPGTFYYHLDKMKGLVEQLPDKSYRLTMLGKKAHALLLQSEQLLVNPRLINETTTNSLDEVITNEISPSLPQHLHHPLFSLLERVYLQKTPTIMTVFQVFLLLGLEAFLAAASGLGVIPLYFDALLYVDPIFTFFQVVMTSLAIWVLLEAGVKIYNWRKTKVLRWSDLSSELIVLIPITQLPMYIYPFLVILSELLLIPFVSDRVIVSMLLFALQLFTSINMAMAVFVTKNIPFDKCFLMSLGVLYVSSLLAWTIAQF